MATSKYRIKKVCEYCGKEFLAQKISTRFCSRLCNERFYKKRKRLEAIARTEQEQRLAPNSATVSDVREKAFLSPEEAARLLGASKRTIYRLIENGKLQAASLSLRLTFIRRSDIETMLDCNPSKAVNRERQTATPITEFYTAEEIQERYHVTYGTLWKIGKKVRLPKVFKDGKNFYSKKHVDAYFAKKKPVVDFDEAYTCEEIMQKYGMTTSAVYCFISKNAIPRKKIGKDTFYSKRHVDAMKLAEQAAQPEWYTIKEACEKFGVSRDALYRKAITYNVPRKIVGRIAYYGKRELDAAFEPPIIP